MKTNSIRIAFFAISCVIATSADGQTNLEHDGPSEIVIHRKQAAVSTGHSLGSANETFPPLAPRIDQASADGGTAADESIDSKLAKPAITVTSSLAVVLGLFAALVWMTRKFNSRSIGQGALPKDVFQGLGSAPIDSRTRIMMARCGNRILVMAQTTNGIQPLAEITDPDEVGQVTAACLGDAKQAFVSTLESIEQEKTESGFLGSHTEQPQTRAPRRLFANA